MTPKKGGYTTPVRALDLSTSLRGDFLRRLWHLVFPVQFGPSDGPPPPPPVGAKGSQNSTPFPDSCHEITTQLQMLAMFFTFMVPNPLVHAPTPHHKTQFLAVSRGRNPPGTTLASGQKCVRCGRCSLQSVRVQHASSTFTSTEAHGRAWCSDPHRKTGSGCVLPKATPGLAAWHRRSVSYHVPCNQPKIWILSGDRLGLSLQQKAGTALNGCQLDTFSGVQGPCSNKFGWCTQTVCVANTPRRRLGVGSGSPEDGPPMMQPWTVWHSTWKTAPEGVAPHLHTAPSCPAVARVFKAWAYPCRTPRLPRPRHISRRRPPSFHFLSGGGGVSGHCNAPIPQGEGDAGAHVPALPERRSLWSASLQKRSLSPCDVMGRDRGRGRDLPSHGRWGEAPAHPPNRNQTKSYSREPTKIGLGAQRREAYCMDTNCLAPGPGPGGGGATLH